MNKLLVILFSAIFLFSFSQELSYRNYSINEGLLSSEVNSIFQDDDGYMWIATKYGVSKYDGYKFKNYTILDGLIENDIIDIYQDKDKNIWLLSANFYLVYIKNDSIYKFEHNNLIQNEIFSEFNYVKRSFLVFDDKIRFAIDKKGLFVIFIKTGKLSLFYTQELVNKKMIITGNRRGLYAIRSKINKDTVFITNKCEQKNTKYIYVSDFLSDISVPIDYYGRNIFLADKNKIVCFTQIGDIEQIIVSDEVISFDIVNNDLWVGTRNKGLFIYDINENGKLKLKNNILEKLRVNMVISDREGGYWIASKNKGVFYIPDINIFNYKLLNINDNEKITDIIVFKNKVYAGTNLGRIFNITDKTEFDMKPKNEKSELKFANDSDFLIISYNKKLYDFSNGLINEFFNFELEDINNFNVKSMQVAANKILLAGESGFVVIEDEVLKKVFNPYKKYRLSINKILQLPDNDIMVASKTGIYLISNSNLENYKPNNPFLNCGINDIYIDKTAKNIYVATEGYGLLKINSDTVTNYGNLDLNSKIILSLYLKDSILSVSSVKGIDLIKIDDNNSLEIIQKYNYQSGLISNEIQKVIIGDSCLYAMSAKGIDKIFFNNESYKSVRPKVFIKNIKINGVDTIRTDVCILPNNQNHIIFEYIGLSFKNAGNIKYRYKLIGSKSNWVITTATKAEYPFLPKGKYKFIVQASNEDGKWSKNPDSCSFEILPPFWETYWFITILILGILLIIYLIVKLIISNIKRKEKLQKDLLMYRQQALRKQMNPHFIFNALNSIQHFILQNDKRMSNKYLNKFSTLMRMVLENSQKELITIEQEITALKLYLEIESIRFKDKFNYSIDIDEDIDTQFYKIPPLLLQPYVENAIWHGLMNLDKDKIGILKIKFNLKGNSIIINIIDNGVGRKKAIEIKRKREISHESLGTKINKKRIDAFNYSTESNINIKFVDMIDDKGEPTGTNVIITIPKISYLLENIF